MLREFREFIMRGNVVDLAVGVVIGVAFGAVVTSFVNDILMPPIGMLTGQLDFSNLAGESYPSLAAAKAAGAPTLNYGLFINTIINLVIVGFAVFLLVKQVNRLKGPPPPPAPVTKECPRCASAIPVKAQRCPHCTSELATA